MISCYCHRVNPAWRLLTAGGYVKTHPMEEVTKSVLWVNVLLILNDKEKINLNTLSAPCLT